MIVVILTCTLLPGAMKLLTNECKVSWIDWYR